MVATLLELLESHFELALRLKQVPLVVIFLCFEEHNFALPKSFIAVIIALEILILSFCLLKLCLHLGEVLSLHRAEMEGLISTSVKI